MNCRIHRSIVLLSLGGAVAAFAAGGLQPYADRVPALPATLAAAGKAFTGQRLDLSPSPAMAQLQKDLFAVQLQSNQAGEVANGVNLHPDVAAVQAQSVDIAQKMEGMSQDQRIAYALQLQQQMAAGAPPKAYALGPAGVANAQHIARLQQLAAADVQQLNALRSHSSMLIDSWSGQDDQLLAKTPLPAVCSAADRALLAKVIDTHVVLAKDSLAQAIALESRLRTLTSGMIARDAEAAALMDSLTGSPQHGDAALMATAVRSNAVSGIVTLSDLYDRGGDRAARWQHMLDWLATFPANPVCAPGGE